KETEAEQSKLVNQMADAQHVDLEAQKVVFLADKALQPLRDEEARTGAALQRLNILSEQLAEEARRSAARRTELGERLRQLEADREREAALLGESDGTLAAYAEEKARLEDDVAGEAEVF